MERLTAAVLFLAASGVLAVPADLTSDTLLLAQARTRMNSNLRRLPDYTCVQTIERFARDTSRGKPRLIDVVRIEVALVGGRELFSWPGSGRFEDTEIGKMVTGGAIGNGNFALHAKAVFQSSAPRWTYVGETERNGRKLLRWDFVVAQNQSGYTIRVGGRQAIVGYHGSIFVEPNSLDLVRLEVHADDPAPFLGLLSSSDAVEYQRVPIGTESFLLPALSELYMVALQGSSNQNRTRFSRCRQYTGESVLLFDDPVEDSASAEPVRVIDAPAGVRVELALAAPIVFTNAAVGDPITAHLTRPMKLPDGVVLPAGAEVHGRIRTLRDSYFGRWSGKALGLSFHEAKARNTTVRFQATLEEIRTAMPGIRTRSAFGASLMQRPENEELTGSVFFVQSNIQQLTKGLRMIWSTTAAPHDDGGQNP